MEAPLNEIAAREPARALLCVDEDELDAWWEEQDVEVKGDAFAMWTLSSGRSHVHIPTVPVTGTIGADDPQRVIHCRAVTPEELAKIFENDCGRPRVVPTHDGEK